MADSIRQDIIDNVEARFQTITVVNGYETDLGANVEWWLASSLPTGVQYALTLEDRSCDISDEDVAIGQHEYALHIEARVITASSGSLTPSVVRKMVADIYKAIGTETDGYKGETWSGLAQRTDLEGDEIDTKQDERKIGGAIVKFAIIYRTNRLNPYL